MDVLARQLAQTYPEEKDSGVTLARVPGAHENSSAGLHL
jgi:hypothetical protein